MLRSVAKFATGFRQLLLLVPQEDMDAALQLSDCSPVPMNVIGYADEPGKGMLLHMVKIMFADKCSDADAFAHIDADCCFVTPVTAESLFVDGKPILRYEPFETLNKRHPNNHLWQEAAQKCLPFPVKWETMRCHPGVFLRETYANARALMERHTNIECKSYILQGENSFPQSFCEFVTLGNVAMVTEADRYYAVKQTSDKPEPDNRLFQAWSHGAIDQPQNLWFRGEQTSIVPLDFINAVLGPEPPPAPRYSPTAADEERMAT